jgi:adenylate cyclase
LALKAKFLMRQWLRNPKRTGIVAVIVGNLAFFALLGLRAIGGLETLELTVYDAFTRLRSQMALPDKRIVLVGVNEHDLERWGWPLSDEVLAQLLERLITYQPRVIGLDIYRDKPVMPGEQRLNKVLTENKNIIVVKKFSGAAGKAGVLAPAVLRNTEQVGFTDVIPDPGGVVRRGILFLDDGYTVEYAFALRMALEYLKGFGIFPKSGNPNPDQLRLQEVTITKFEPNDGSYIGADAGGYQFLLDFEGPPEQFKTYPLNDILSNRIPLKRLRDKIVIIGVTAESVKDYFYTPLSQSLSVDQRLYGITLHAYITSQLLRAGLQGVSPIHSLSEGLEVTWIWTWTILGGLLGLGTYAAWRFALFVSLGVLVISAVCYLALLHRWWLPTVPAVLGWTVAAALVVSYMYRLERVGRDHLMQLFSRYLSHDVAESLWQQRDKFLEGGRPRPQKLTATVFFSDLKGFTPVAEQMDDRPLWDWLEHYLETMAKLVMLHGGIVDKFMGDGIMAVFGVPVPRKNATEIRQDAIHAVDCALAMKEALDRLNKEWQQQHLPTIGMRIGIFTGPLRAGSVGSQERMQYTAIGDTVNAASRLESFDKNGTSTNSIHTSCRILIGETTLQQVAGRYEIQHVGAVRLKGKQIRINAYTVIGKL